MAKSKENIQVNKINLLDSKGKKKDTIELNKDIFRGKYTGGLLYQAVNIYRSNQRRGTASTKTRSEVRGGGKKPWRQKGTGRARVASIRNPIWRGGGVVFGPHPRDFRRAMPRTMKAQAFIASMNAKLKSGEVVAVENIPLTKPKTREIVGFLKKTNLKGSILLLVETIDRNLALAVRNIKGLTLVLVDNATALNVMSHDHVLITTKAMERLQKRILK